MLACVVGFILANMEFLFLGPHGESASIVAATVSERSFLRVIDIPIVLVAVSLGMAATSAVLVRIDIYRDTEGGQRHFLLTIGALVTFSAGRS